MSEVNMNEDWLSVALQDDDENHRVASTNRALVAIKHRTDKRFARYMKLAQSEVEAAARLGAIDSDIRAMANEIAVEYSSPEPDKLYEAAVEQAKQSASVPDDGYDSRTVDPDSVIGDSPAGARGESFKGTDKSLDEVREPSKNHPAETQNVEQRPGKREEWLNPGAKDDGFGGEAPIDRKVKNEDLGGANPHTEQKGEGGSFGQTHNVADPVTPGTVMASQWHVME